MSAPTCACEGRLVALMAAIESGALDGVVIGALRAAAITHPELRYRSSMSKRVRAAIKARIHELVHVATPARFDPWRRHCPTCACTEDVATRTNGCLPGPQTAERDR